MDARQLEGILLAPPLVKPSLRAHYELTESSPWPHLSNFPEKPQVFDGFHLNFM